MMVVLSLLIFAAIFGYFAAAAIRIDHAEEELSHQIDVAVPVWSRLPLYDWEQEHDFG